MQKVALALMLLCLCISCRDQGVVSAPQTDWVEYHSKDAVPAVLIDTLRKLSHDSFRLADFGAPYEATDFVLADSNGQALPRRQLRYLATNGEEWQLTYRHGGFGLHYHFIACRVADGIVRFDASWTTVQDLDNRLQIDSAPRGLGKGIRNGMPVISFTDL